MGKPCHCPFESIYQKIRDITFSEVRCNHQIRPPCLTKCIQSLKAIILFLQLYKLGDSKCNIHHFLKTGKRMFRSKLSSVCLEKFSIACPL